MRTASCAVCGGREPLEALSAREPYGLTAEPLQLVRCASCGHLYVSPRPEGAELSRFYFREYYRGSGRLAAAFEFLKSARVVAGRPAGRLLDVGCGDGAFLEAMQKRGWEGWGVETAQDGAALARARPGLTIIEKPLPGGGLPAGQFDMVTLWHSIEHMEDPAAVLNEARRVLKDGGTLFLAFPNGASWEFSLFGARWFHLDMPRHLHLFSPRGMERLLAACGFQVERIDGWAWDYNVFGFVQSALNAVSFETNRLYKTLKGQKLSVGAAARTWDLAVLLFLAAPLAALGAVFSAVAALVGRAACVEVYARARGETR